MRNLIVYAVILGAVSAAIPVAHGQAQSSNSADSTQYLKAYDMVNNGDPEDGHALLDSLLRAAKPGTPQYAEGLYWRARLSSMGPNAEKDYRRIIVDYPDNQRAPYALLKLGQLELNRGDRDGATVHFQRLVMDYPGSSAYAAGNYWLARAYFEANKIERACAANAEALAKVGSTDVELKNQIDFQNQQCRGVALTPPDPKAKAAAKAKAAKAKAKAAEQPTDENAEMSADDHAKPVDDSAADMHGESVAATSEGGDEATEPPPAKTAKTAKTTKGAKSESKTVPAKAAAAAATAAKTTKAKPSFKVPVVGESPETKSEKKVTYAVQVAAYRTKEQATELVASLKKQGIIAHIDGAEAPFRVRVGHYTTRAEAAALLERLKARQIEGFITQG